MLEVTIKDVAVFSGTFEVDVDTDQFSGDDWSLIKKIADVRMGEYPDALANADYDVFMALSLIALLRAERIQPRQVMTVAATLRREPMNKFSFEFKDEAEPELDAEGEPLPPSVPPTGGSETNEPDVNSTTSSEDSPSTGDGHQVTSPASTGAAGSAVTPAFPSET